MIEAAEKKPGVMASRRNQRRLLAGGVLVLVAGGVAAAFAFLGNTAESLDTPLSDEPAQVFEQKQSVAVDKEARRVAGRFILTAVSRKDIAASYDLIHPDLLQGMTRQQWATGNIPIVPYPADQVDLATFKVDESYADEVYMQVALIPKEGVKAKPQIFFIGLKRDGEKGPWKVSYWVPRATTPVPSVTGS